LLLSQIEKPEYLFSFQIMATTTKTLADSWCLEVEFLSPADAMKET
jgi:hypothetical protein